MVERCERHSRRRDRERLVARLVARLVPVPFPRPQVAPSRVRSPSPAAATAPRAAPPPPAALRSNRSRWRRPRSRTWMAEGRSASCPQGEGATTATYFPCLHATYLQFFILWLTAPCSL